jgi:beta-galactosidase
MLPGLVGSVLGQTSQDTVPPRERESINLDWRFQKNDPPEASGWLDYELIKPWILPSRNDFMANPASRVVAPPGNPGADVGYNLSFVTVNVSDKHGQVVPDARNLIHFTLSGPGEIVGLDNGDATSFKPFQGSEHHAWNGKCLVIIRSKAGMAGRIKLTATTEGLAAADETIQARVGMQPMIRGSK